MTITCHLSPRLWKKKKRRQECCLKFDLMFRCFVGFATSDILTRNNNSNVTQFTSISFDFDLEKKTFNVNQWIVEIQ